MPVWHETVKEWVKQGRLALVGVTQEQHPERCRLFAQWKEFEWPILHDPINVLNTTGVPIVIAIDEHGVVRAKRPSRDDFQTAFLDRQFAAPADGSADLPRLTPLRDAQSHAEQAGRTDNAEDWRELGDSLAIWQPSERLNDAIDAYSRAVAGAPDDFASHFRLGVCLRMRHESEGRLEGDFSSAVAAWETALAGNPNQYIWRRRIQQFGPRLIKPYPFYDWVDEAEATVTGRGETPVRLRVRPTGAEIAQPSKEFAVDDQQAKSPDPKGVIFRDDDELIQSAVTTVPSQVSPGSTTRVHVSFVPNTLRKAHWNNESEPLQLWIDPPAGGQVTRQLLKSTMAKAAVSSEVRRLDFEVQVPEGAQSTVEFSAYALYYVCEDVDGQCRFLRQDIPIRIDVGSK